MQCSLLCNCTFILIIEINISISDFSQIAKTHLENICTRSCILISKTVCCVQHHRRINFPAGACTKVTEDYVEVLHDKSFQETVILNSCHGHFHQPSVPVCICMEISRRIIQADHCLRRTQNPQAEKLQFPGLYDSRVMENLIKCQFTEKRLLNINFRYIFHSACSQISQKLAVQNCFLKIFRPQNYFDYKNY